MTTAFDEMKIRLPKHMKEWLKERAQENSRTLNGEVIHLLKQEIAATGKEKA